MGRLSFDAVDTLIYDPVSANRTATRAALYSLGFRRTETVPTLENFFERIQNSPPDLALCEAQGATDELCLAIQSLRQGGAGHNPFIVVIVTAWEKNDGLIRQVVSSGADDLLLRPFSTALLGQRIEAHIERRKGFVITAEYVGPDRRKELHHVSNADLFEPPNSLKMKAKEKLPGEVIARRLDAELKAARESGVLVQNRQAGGGDAVPAMATPTASRDQAAPKLALDPTNDPNAQARKEAFVSNLDPRGDVVEALRPEEEAVLLPPHPTVRLQRAPQLRPVFPLQAIEVARAALFIETAHLRQRLD